MKGNVKENIWIWRLLWWTTQVRYIQIFFLTSCDLLAAFREANWSAQSSKAVDSLFNLKCQFKWREFRRSHYSAKKVFSGTIQKDGYIIDKFWWAYQSYIQHQRVVENNFICTRCCDFRGIVVPRSSKSCLSIFKTEHSRYTAKQGKHIVFQVRVKASH